MRGAYCGTLRHEKAQGWVCGGGGVEQGAAPVVAGGKGVWDVASIA